ncbi:hypothetical protein ONZ45_g16992 [Pleurotus djamor]|nr:hypothetical protein ONZ45_g16992 [Pleurotus djamor]
MPQQMPQPMPQPAQKQRKRPPAALRIDTPAHNPQIAHVVQDSITSASATDSAASDYFSSPFNNMPRSSRNKLSLTLSSARSSTHSLTLVDRADEPPQTADPTSRPNRPRRPSVISLPPPSNPTSLLQRREEEEGDGEPSYSDGPIQIIPNVWLGSEENARDWKTLHTLGIKCILNVAKEVSSPFDSVASIVPRPLRPVASTPNLNNSKDESKGTYYPPHVPSGRPDMHYLKMQWSHGQQNLVDEGFPDAMSFCDAAQDRGEGVLIHCQCGVSRSATMVIALVMRAAAENSPHVPPEIWELKGMQGAYSYVKEKSKWSRGSLATDPAPPSRLQYNGSPEADDAFSRLIYQLIEYERKLKGDSSPASSERSSAIAEEEEEWGRRRRLLDESEGEDDAQAEAERESNAVLAEAQALDKAMEARIVAKRASASSLTSNSSGLGNGVGMGPAWRNRYAARKRTGSVASSCHSMISEDLVEEDEEPALLGVGGGFDDDRPRLSFASSTNSSATSSVDPESATNSPEDGDGTYPNVSSPSDDIFTPATARPLPSISAFPLPPPSAPAWKTSFSAQRISVPHTASRATFDLSVGPLDRSSVPRSAFEDVSTTPKPVTKPIKSRKRPPLGSLVLPPVPSSPITIIADEPESPVASQTTYSTSPRIRSSSHSHGISETSSPATTSAQLYTPQGYLLSLFLFGISAFQSRSIEFPIFLIIVRLKFTIHFGRIVPSFLLFIIIYPTSHTSIITISQNVATGTISSTHAAVLTSVSIDFEHAFTNVVCVPSITNVEHSHSVDYDAYDVSFRPFYGPSIDFNEKWACTIPESVDTAG